MGGSVVSPEKRSRGPRALLRGGIPTPAEARQKMAAEHDAIKKRKVSEIVEGSAAAAPPPPPNPTEQKLTIRLLSIIVKLAAGGNMSLQVCLGTLISFATIIGMSLGLALFLPIMRESSTAQFLSTLAAILQTISQLIPFYSAVTNIVSCVLCFVSLCLHLTYALRPTPEENAAAEDDPEHQD
nr:unnamed protein product [Digitaria exilis]